MGEHDRSYELLNYENKWVAFLEPDDKTAGPGDGAYEAKMDAERNGTCK